jgi:chemosensory pili system protein ChpA (sensor histidine kinase/response regulator)
VITLHQGLQKNIDETELAIHAQARLNRELQQGLMGVRLVPLGNLADRLLPRVRQTAKELDKKPTSSSRAPHRARPLVLEKITGPSSTCLRNADRHGIELPADARAPASPRSARSRSTPAARQRGGAHHRRRRRRPQLPAHPPEGGRGRPARPRRGAARVAARAVHLHVGFSTATELTEISGRGVGMDVVKNEITSLGGRVEIASTPGAEPLHDHAARSRSR